MDWMVRRARPSGQDLAICAGLMAATDPWQYLGRSREQCAESLRRPELTVDLAVDPDDRILGFLASMASGIAFEPLIEYLCVDADFRNLGIGAGLISHFEEELFFDSANLYLFVSDINPNAQRLYIRLGYLPVGALANYNLTGQTEFLFRKTRGPRQRDRQGNRHDYSLG